MDKASQRAFEAYPKRKDGRLRGYYCTDDDIRKLYARGYRKAEKDLALTWKDIRDIDEWISVVQTSDNLVGEELYTEVLRKFNEQKSK